MDRWTRGPPQAQTGECMSIHMELLGLIACCAVLAHRAIVQTSPMPPGCRRDMTHSVGTLLDELDIPRAISAPPQLDDRWALHLVR